MLWHYWLGNMKDIQPVKIILSQVFFHRGLLDRQGEGRCCWQFCILAQFGTWGALRSFHQQAFNLFNHGSTCNENPSTFITHICRTALCPELPRWAGTRKVKPTWILLKQETVSGSGISWTICKSAPRSRQISTPAPNHSVFYRPDALPATQPTASKHWKQITIY